MLLNEILSSSYLGMTICMHIYITLFFTDMALTRTLGKAAKEISSKVALTWYLSAQTTGQGYSDLQLKRSPWAASMYSQLIITHPHLSVLVFDICKHTGKISFCPIYCSLYWNSTQISCINLFLISICLKSNNTKNISSYPEPQLWLKQFSLELPKKLAPGGHWQGCEHPERKH